MSPNLIDGIPKCVWVCNQQILQVDIRNKILFLRVVIVCELWYMVESFCNLLLYKLDYLTYLGRREAIVSKNELFQWNIFSTV